MYIVRTFAAKFQVADSFRGFVRENPVLSYLQYMVHGPAVMPLFTRAKLCVKSTVPNAHLSLLCRNYHERDIRKGDLTKFSYIIF